MPPFFVPTPCIIPLRLPVFGENRNINTNTKIELLCETDIPNVEIFYTLDGTKPQPYLGIVQGSKIKKYSEPFCLPSGKVTVKAMAIHAQLHTMFSSVITKSFHVDCSGPKLKTLKNNSKKKIKCRDSSKSVSKPTKAKSIESEDLSLKTVESEDKSLESDDKSWEDKYAMPVADRFLLTDFNESAIEFKDKDSIDSNATYVVETDDDLSEQEEPVSELFESTLIIDEEEKYFKDEETTAPVNVPSPQSHDCAKCEMPLQHCFSCNKVNAIISKYCDKCGEKLVQECKYCKESNPSIAIFCQYCGKKIDSNATSQEIENRFPRNSNQYVMAKPQMKSFAAQKTPATASKYVQTSSLINRKNVQQPDLKKLPSHTPGRGYWRQQIDYICNHLKAHAYNNLDFRKSIGEPSLHQFLSANVNQESDNIIVKIVFSSVTSEQIHVTAQIPESKDGKC